MRRGTKPVRSLGYIRGFVSAHPEPLFGRRLQSHRAPILHTLTYVAAHVAGCALPNSIFSLFLMLGGWLVVSLCATLTFPR